MRLCHKERPQSDKAAKALACYGLYLPEHQEQSRMHGRMLLRFVQGRPVSALTCRFLSWLAQQLESEGWKVLVLFWDNASWHVSRQVRAWIGQHNRQVKRCGGLRLLVCPLPKKSPWLNNIEPSGCMASAWSWNRNRYSRPRRWPSDCAATTAVSSTNI